eukprot:g28437.t1
MTGEPSMRRSFQDYPCGPRSPRARYCAAKDWERRPAEMIFHSVVAADLYPPDAPTDPSAVPPTLERELAKEQGTSRAADSRGHRTIAGAVLLGIFLGFVLLMALSTAMFHAFRNIAVTPASLLGAPHNEQLVVGAAQAVDHCQKGATFGRSPL